MEIILLSIACIMNAAAIIIHLVSHIRGNRRKGFGASYADIKRAMELQRYMEKANKAGESVHDQIIQLYGAPVSH